MMDFEAASEAEEFLVATVVPKPSGPKHKLRRLSAKQLERFLHNYRQAGERLLAVVPDEDWIKRAGDRR
jgi:hypothetical protein